MDAPFRESGLGDLIAEIAEMTMNISVPLPSGGSLALPSYPWTPELIENMDERERIIYRDRLRAQRKHILNKG